MFETTNQLEFDGFFQEIGQPHLLQTCHTPLAPTSHTGPRVVNATSVWLFFASCLGEKIMASLVNLCYRLYQHVSTIR